MAYSLHEETRIILAKYKKPMTAKEIYGEIKKRGNISLRTATPVASLSSALYKDIKKKGKASKFIKIEKINLGKLEKYYSLNKL
jgi:DNA-directed RNA polymerase delta subunit